MMEEKKTYTNYQVGSYMATFFLAMVGHDLALEAAFKSFSHVDALAAAVTLFQFGSCLLLPLILTQGKVLSTFPRTAKQGLPYLQLSLLVFGATFLATQSLHYVSYPTKCVFKSAKLIPTMLVYTFLLRGEKKHDSLDYFAASLLCLGTAGYGYGSSKPQDDTNTSSFGILLLSISIICDALVPNLQQRLMTSSSLQGVLPERKNIERSSLSSSEGLSAQAVMTNVNAVGFAMVLSYMVGSGAFVGVIAASIAHPRLLFLLVSLGGGLSTAVLAYTKLIKSSGSVVAVATSTLRKVVTVVLSYVFFPKPLSTLHVFSGLLVLAGILISAFRKK